jgi:hypothetical protein
MKQFEFTTTHALSILVMVLLFIFVFQPSIYENMINTLLGRLTLLFILILVTSHSTILGLGWTAIIISFYEYYSRFEGAQNMNVDHSRDALPQPKKKPVPNDSMNNSPQEIIPENDETIEDPSKGSTAMDSGTKADKEGKIQKGHSSNALPILKMLRKPNVSPSESTTTTNVASKQGFASMFGDEYESV